MEVVRKVASVVTPAVNQIDFMKGGLCYGILYD